MLPWQDRSGRLAPLKLLVFVGLLAPGLWLLGRTLAGDLGARPYNEAIQFVGLWTIRLVFLSLAVTPLRKLLTWQRLVTVRRMVGVAACGYALLHLSLYAVDQNLDLGHVASEIALRYYLLIGFTALIGLVVLGATSTDGAIRRLGKRWRRLHRLVYPIAVVALVHFFLQSKLNVTEPVLMAGLLVWLLGFRVLARRRIPGPAALAALALGAAVATAAIETAWYAVATGAMPLRVLAANLDVSYGLRPALWVLIVTLGVALLVLGRKALKRARPWLASIGARLDEAREPS
jgi:sulfoxide reductase heme-binding subunit YedZ